MDFTFLKKDQIWGDHSLDVMKRYGTKVAPTDLAVILGANIDPASRTSEGDVPCSSWSASTCHEYDYIHTKRDYFGAYLVNFNGRELDCFGIHDREISERPALSSEAAYGIILKNIHEGPNGVQIGEFGEYPQTVADKETSEKLERLYKTESLSPTGKNYTFDSADIEDYDTPFKATSYPEYEMDGKRYIRVPGRSDFRQGRVSTGELVEVGKPYWVEVQPIEWLIDRSGTMVAKKCLFAGIQFDTKDSYDGDFSKTSMKHYLDTYFAKEMMPLEQTASKSNNIDLVAMKMKNMMEAKR